MIKTDNKYYVKEVTKKLQEEHNLPNITEDQVKKVIDYITRNIVTNMFKTRDIELRGYFNLRYNKSRVARYHSYKLGKNLDFIDVRK